MSRSSKGHHFIKLWWAEVPDATYQVSWKSAHGFWRRRFLSVFYHIWAWRPSWSCDLDFAIKLEMPLPKEAPHKVSTRSAKWFQRRRSLKLWTTPTDGRTDGRRTDAGSWPSYKLTLWAFGSGELKLKIKVQLDLFITRFITTWFWI